MEKLISSFFFLFSSFRSASKEVYPNRPKVISSPPKYIQDNTEHSSIDILAITNISDHPAIDILLKKGVIEIFINCSP